MLFHNFPEFITRFFVGKGKHYVDLESPLDDNNFVLKELRHVSQFNLQTTSCLPFSLRLRLPNGAATDCGDNI